MTEAENNKGKRKKVEANHFYEVNELPALNVQFSKFYSDFMTEYVSLNAKGNSVKDAAAGINFLLASLPHIRKVAKKRARKKEGDYFG